MDINAIQPDTKVKVCRWRLDDNCFKVSTQKGDFTGACCKVCLKYKNEVYYMQHRENLLQRSKAKYTHKGRPKKYNKKNTSDEEPIPEDTEVPPY